MVGGLLSKRVLRYPLNVIHSLSRIKDAYCCDRLLNFLSKETGLLEGSFNPHIVSKNSFDVLHYLFTCFYTGRFHGQRIDTELMEDYIHMSLLNERWPNVKIKSFKRLKMEHDLLAGDIALSAVPDFSIPDPKLLLPEKDGYEFKCICNKDQLLKESREMHHCVAIYAQDILSGESVIYSIHGKERATAEFIDYGNGYRLIQVKAHHNKNVSEALEKLLESLIEKCEKRNTNTQPHFAFTGDDVPF